jgi:uncharacterized protein (DUF433 family)
MDQALAREALVDWQNCDLVEIVAGKQGGVPLVKRTRIPAQQIVEESELGSPVEEIAENYPSITMDEITALLVYAHEHKSQPAL